jgi:hypothetical protein
MPNEVQQLAINGAPGSGKFTVTFNDATTDPIQYHPAAGVLQTALQALPTIGAGNVVVTKPSNWAYDCGFTGDLSDQSLPSMTADDSQLGGGATITITTLVEGGSDEPPPGNGERPQLDTPCTLTELFAFVQNIRGQYAGNYHNIPVTTDTENLYLE